LEDYTITTNAAGLGQYIWNINSLYDPDRTGTGFQPTYFDQLSEIYGRYRVYGCKVDIKVFNPQSSNPLWFSWITSGDQSSISEDPSSIAMNNKGSPLRFVSSEGSNNVGSITRYIPINRVFGVPKKAIMSEQNYSGVSGNFGTGSDPNSTARLILDIKTYGASVSVIVQTSLTFYAQFERQSAVLES
jgi:hypothetical protein